MDRTYHTNIDGNEVIILDERSSIGYSYPRIFVMFKEQKEVTVRSGNKVVWHGMSHDVCLGQTFSMTREDFDSWLDGTEINVSDIRDICKNLSINYDGLVKLINTIC